MRRNTLATTDRRTTTRPAPLPGRAPRRTTAGLVAATLVPAVVVAAAFAPVATTAVAAVVVTFVLATAAAPDVGGRDEGTDPGDAPTPPDGVAAD